MSQTADRYAKALFEIALEQDHLEDIQSSMTELRVLIIRSDEFRQFVKNPLLSYEERCHVLKVLFEGKMHELILRFLLFITYKSRLPILKKIIESFDHMYLSNTSQMRVYVKTALPVTDQDKGLFDQYFQAKFRHKTITHWTLEPSLIGGFRIFSQGTIYDYSFKNQLEAFMQHVVQ